MLELLIGEYATGLTAGQAALLERAAEEAPDGLRQVAEEIRQAGSSIDSPIAVLVNRVTRQQHVERQQRRACAPPPPPRVPRFAAPLLSAEQIKHNQRTARLMRRTRLLRATEAVQRAVGDLRGDAALEAAEAALDEIDNEPDPIEET